jgi:Leucine-rich repeat (LRR) protein
MKLNSLDASNNNLSIIPRVVFTFAALEKLDLSFNFVEDINPSLCFLTCLLDLNISNNTIHSYGLGCSIKNLVNLTSLDLSDNKISFLLPKPPQPWEFWASLTALTRLELKGNNLRELPWEWGIITSISELSLTLKSSTLPEVLSAWSERGIQGIVETYAAKTAEWLAIQYSGKIPNDTSILQSAIQCKTPGDTLAMDETEPTVHKQSLVSLVRVLEESECANQSALLEYKYLLSSTSEWHIPGLFLSLSQVKTKSDPDPTETVSKKMSANTFLSNQNTQPKVRLQEAGCMSKKQFYASGLSVSKKDTSSAVFIDPFSQIPSVGRAEDMSRHASLLQESGKIWGTHVPSKPNLDEVLEAIESIDSIGHNLLFGDGQGKI